MNTIWIFIFFIFIILFCWILFLLFKTKKQFKKSQNDLLQLKDILYTAPHGYYFEYQTTDKIFSYCSDKLRLLLNITDKTSPFQNLIKNINSKEYHTVLKLFYDLKEQEKPFDTEITDSTTQMHFSLNGRIIYSTILNQKLFIVWFNNHSFEHQRLLIEQKEAQILSEKINIFSSALNLIPFPIALKKGNFSFINTFLKKNETETTNFHWNELKASFDEADSLSLRYGQDKTSEEGLQVLLKDTETTYKQLLKELPLGVALFNSTGKLQFFNSIFSNHWMLDHSFLKKMPSFEDILDKIQEKNLLLQIKDFSLYKKTELEIFLNLTHTREEFLYLSGNKIIKQTMLVAPKGGILILTEQK